ncbi:MAG: hypothetical protein RSE93_02060 [Oscillospiraceae bacterium]
MTNKYAYASNLGRIVKILPTKSDISFYSVGFVLIAIYTVFMAAAFFIVGILLENAVLTFILPLIGGITAFFMIRTFLRGKLRKYYKYEDIQCICYELCALNIYDNNGGMYSISISEHQYAKLIYLIHQQLIDSEYKLKKEYGRIYFSPKN